MPTAHRRQRAHQTEELVAQYFRDHGYPYATAVGSGRGGTDVLHVDRTVVEVKACKTWEPRAWLRQAVGHATDGETSVVVARGDGQGPKTVDDWPAFFTLRQAVGLLRTDLALRQVLDALMDGDDPQEVAVFIQKVLMEADHE